MSDDNNQAIRDVVKGAGIVYIGLFLELVIAFFAQVLAARYLSVGGFGGLTAGTALLDIGAILGGLGLAGGLTRYLPRVDAAQKRMLAAASVLVTFSTSLVVGILVVLVAPFLAEEVFGSPGVTVSIRIFGAAIPFAALLNVAVGGVRGQEKSLYRVYVKNLVHPMTRIVLIVGAVVYGLDQSGFAGAYAIPYVVSAVFALWLLYRSLPRAQTTFDRGLFSEVTRYSLPFVISGVSGFVYRSIDVFLILYFLGDEATGIYGVAYAAVSFMGMFSTALNYLSTPIASRLQSTGDIDHAMDLFELTARWLLVASVCALIPLSVFAADFITIIYGSKYTSGGIILSLLAIGFASKNILSIHGPMLQALGRSKILSLNSVIAAVSNLALNIVLIPALGISGAALATVISFTIRDGLASIQVYQSLNRTPLTRHALLPVIVAMPLLAVLFLLKSAIPTRFLWLLGVSGLSSAVYIVIILLLFGLSSKEVMIFRSVQERFGVQFGLIDRLLEYLEN